MQTRTALAPALGAVTALSMGKDIQTGKVEAVEIGSQIPGQMSVADIQGAQPDQPADAVEVEGRTVDTATGEIVEESGKVIDLRKKA